MMTSIGEAPKLLWPQHALLMKVGFHGTEEWDEILVRKVHEARISGYCLWGYGGTTCHPTHQVQPFAHTKDVTFVGIPTPSRFTADGSLAHQMSVNGEDWTNLSPDQMVSSSRYALCLTDLRISHDTVPVGDYIVGIGAKTGTPATDYLRYRCDKACVSRITHTGDDPRGVSLLAQLTFPYAVYLR
jgi:hypothetical protein